MQADSRPSILTIDARLEAKEEGYAPAHEMPIKKLAFTPYKGASEPIVQQMADSEAVEHVNDIPADIEQRAEAVPSTGASSENDNIKVFLRVKPLPAGYTGESTMTVVDDTTVALLQPMSSGGDLAAERILKVTDQDKYRFTRVLGPETQQQTVYEEAARPMVEALVEGQDGLIFAYGPTNSGKTFTIQGEKGESAGLLPRILSTLFELVSARAAGGEGAGWTVWVTYMEIYNENVYDLLDQPADRARNEQRKVCKLKEHNGHVHVKGLRELQVRCLDEARQVLRYGARQRQVAETMMNESSSRSHCVFNVKLVPDRGPDTDPTDPAQVLSKLSVVDLAGSERATRTRATGERLKEASNINVSLMNLGRCLEALRWNQLNPNKVAHVVPFRHSKLTRIFQDHFQNASKMAMIVAANPHQEDFDEALHALRYGAIAKEVNVQKTMNTRKPLLPAPAKKTSAEGAKHIEGECEGGGEWEEVQVDALVEELEALRAEVYLLQAKNAQLETTVREEVSEEMMRQMAQMEAAFQVRLEDERVSTEQKFERRLRIIMREQARRDQTLSDAERDQIQVELEFYQGRVSEMQREHKTALSRLMPGPAPAHTDTDADEQEEEREEGREEREGGESMDELRNSVRFLTAKVSELQRGSEEQAAEVEKKRRQAAESRVVLEEADGVIRQMELRAKQLEDHNDRLREELAAAQEEAAASKGREEARDALHANNLRVLNAKIDALQAHSSVPAPAPVHTVTAQAPAPTPGPTSGAAKDETEGLPRPGETAPAPASASGNSKGQGGARGAVPVEMNVQECPVHLLSYMLPDDESYQRCSPLRAHPLPLPQRTPLSPSSANIKANSHHLPSTAPTVLPVKEVTSASRSAKGVRRLFNQGGAEMAEELNAAAGAMLVEPSPIVRRLRSTRTTQPTIV